MMFFTRTNHFQPLPKDKQCISDQSGANINKNKSLLMILIYLWRKGGNVKYICFIYFLNKKIPKISNSFH